MFDVDVTGGTNKFQNRTFKVARHCVGKEAAEQDVGEVKWNPASGESDSGDGGPLTDLGRREMNDALPLEAEGDLTASSTASAKKCAYVNNMGGSSSPCTRTAPIPDSPPLSAQ